MLNAFVTAICIIAIIYFWNYIRTMIKLEDDFYKTKKDFIMDVVIPFYGFFKKHYTILSKKYDKLK